MYWEFRLAIGKTHSLPVHKENAIYWTIIKNWVELARGQGSIHSDQELEEDKHFIEAYTHTVMRNGNVDQQTKNVIADSYLIDIAAGSIMKKAEADSTGKKVGSKEHSVLIGTVQLIADLSRRRRATYGSLWVEAARQSIRTNRDSWRHGYSPSRNQSYILNSRPTLALDEASLKSKVMERMLLDGSSAIIGPSATANNILQTYKNLLSIIENKKCREKDIEILNTTSIMVDRT